MEDNMLLVIYFDVAVNEWELMMQSVVDIYV